VWPSSLPHLVHILRQAAVDDLLLDRGGHQGGALDLDVINACQVRGGAHEEVSREVWSGQREIADGTPGIILLVVTKRAADSLLLLDRWLHVVT
jgi:hypothetical protein